MSRLERERNFHDRRYSSDGRDEVDRLYSVLQPGRDEFARLASEQSVGADVLEIGCGRGARMTEVCPLARSGVAIDISSTAIERARQNSDDSRWSFSVMDAVNTDFESGSLDLIIGTGIVHHLDIGPAFAEIRRLLKPGGVALFLEPLGYNPVLNAYRRRTPNLRSPDERPLRRSDLSPAGLAIRVRQYGLLSAALVLGPVSLRGIAERACRAELEYLSRVPGLRWFAWYALLEVQRSSTDCDS